MKEEYESDEEDSVNTLRYDPNINWREEIIKDYESVCKRAVYIATCGKANSIDYLMKVDCLCEDMEELNLEVDIVSALKYDSSLLVKIFNF